MSTTRHLNGFRTLLRVYSNGRVAAQPFWDIANRISLTGKEALETLAVPKHFPNMVRIENSFIN